MIADPALLDRTCGTRLPRLAFGYPIWVIAVTVVVTVASTRGLALPDEPREGGDRPRLLVLTDIGGDPDDMQSMRRLMLYANEFEIAGLIASASGTPGELRDAVTRPELIHEIVEDYAAVVANLRNHADDYPDPDALRSVIRAGSPDRGVANLGAGRSTEGSRQIISAVDASPRPLHVAIWGGAHDLAQALFDVRASRPESEVAAFVAKLRVYAIADQDKTRPDVPGTGEWIREHFPELRYVESGPPGMSRFAAAFRGMYQNDSRDDRGLARPLVSDDIAVLNQRAWVEANVRTDHGAIGSHYPIVNQNPSSSRNTSGVKEGDTPSWFFVLPNGLGDAENPTLGGWGGRFRLESGGHYIDAEDEHPSGVDDPAIQRKWTVARWRRAYQNDFAARLDWCVSDRAEANHNPVAVVNGVEGRSFVRRSAVPGADVPLDASASTDPDGDGLRFRWWVYTDCSRIRSATISDALSPTAKVRIPEVAKPGTVHVILEVTDDGAPPLTSYRRVIIRVGPSEGPGTIDTLP